MSSSKLNLEWAELPLHKGLVKDASKKFQFLEIILLEKERSAGAKIMRLGQIIDEPRLGFVTEFLQKKGGAYDEMKENVLKKLNFGHGRDNEMGGSKGIPVHNNRNILFWECTDPAKVQFISIRIPDIDKEDKPLLFHTTSSKNVANNAFRRISQGSQVWGNNCNAHSYRVCTSSTEDMYKAMLSAQGSNRTYTQKGPPPVSQPLCFFTLTNRGETSCKVWGEVNELSIDTYIFVNPSLLIKQKNKRAALGPDQPTNAPKRANSKPLEPRDTEN